MSAPFSSRVMLRQSRLLLRRNNIRQASTTEQAASKAKNAASNVQSKASEGLSKVQSSASSIASSASETASSTASQIQSRSSGYVSFITETVIPQTAYYSRVGLELGRLIFNGQKMAPPSMSTVQTYMAPMTNAFRNPTKLTESMSHLIQPEAMLHSIRNVNSAQLATIGIIAAEVLGFFTVGEMLGRLKIVGYHGEVDHIGHTGSEAE